MPLDAGVACTWPVWEINRRVTRRYREVGVESSIFGVGAVERSAQRDCATGSYRRRFPMNWYARGVILRSEVGLWCSINCVVSSPMRRWAGSQVARVGRPTDENDPRSFRCLSAPAVEGHVGQPRQTWVRGRRRISERNWPVGEAPVVTSRDGQSICFSLPRRWRRPTWSLPASRHARRGPCCGRYQHREEGG